MKFTKTVLATILSLSILSGCTTLGEYGIDKQKIGTGIGAVVGIGVGSLVGGGMGKKVAMVVGGVAGGYIGNRIGASLDEQDKVSLEAKTVSMLNGAKPASGASTSWMSEDTKASASIVAGPEHVKKSVATVKAIPAVEASKDITPINEQYVALRDSNIRLAPRINSQKISSLPAGTKFTAVGKTASGWTMISRKDVVIGYVKSDLTKKYVAEAKQLTPVKDIDQQNMIVEKPSVSKSATRADSLGSPVELDFDSVNPQDLSVSTTVSCRNLQYKIKDKSGSPSESAVEACKNDRGDWVVL